MTGQAISVPKGFFSPPVGFDDPLFPTIMSFAAAHRHIGPGALMRRFPMGRRQALSYLSLLRACRVCMGQAGYRAHVYRVNPHAWRSLHRYA